MDLCESHEKNRYQVKYAGVFDSHRLRLMDE